MDRIVDISSDDQHLCRYRGFLVVEQNGAEIGRVALDEILALVVHAHGSTYSHSLLCELAGRGAIVVLCGSNHFPVAYITPCVGHHRQAARTQAQFAASLPRKKQLWKDIVIAKILMQAAVLDAFGRQSNKLVQFAKRVRSGDPENYEAQAARSYWQELFGKEFRRDRSAEDANSLLNYGYTVLRATVARAVVAAGFVPAVSLHHHNQLNAFALADDLMEPYRPIVDACVFNLVRAGESQVTSENKQILAGLIALDLNCGDRLCPMTSSIESLCFSLGECFTDPRAKPQLPKPMTALELRNIGVQNVEA